MRVMGISLLNSASGRTLTMIVFSSTTTFSTSARTTERYRKTVGATEYFSDAIVRRAGNAEPVEQSCRVGQRLDHNADHDTFDLLSGERIDLIANFLVDN